MVEDTLQCRDEQLGFLTAFINKSPALSPPVLFLEGPNGSGKTHILKHFLEQHSDVMSIYLSAKDLIFSKSLCQRVAMFVFQFLRKRYPEVSVDAMDPFEAEDVYQLQKFMNRLLLQFQQLNEAVNLYIVLDGLDEISQINLETPAQLIALPSCISQQSKIHLRLIVSFSKSSFLANYATYDIPTIIFPKYTPAEIERILLTKQGYSDDPTLIDKLTKLSQNNESTRKEIFKNYVHFITEALIAYTGNNPTVLNDIMGNKWPAFLESLNEQNVKSTVMLYKSNIDLFNRPNETLVRNKDQADYKTLKDPDQSNYSSHALCFMAKYLLIAAYLASYLNHRYDSKVFSKKSHLRGGRSSYGRRSKLAHNPRYLQPSAFALERMLAIFQSIYPVQISKELSPDFFQRDVHMKSNVEVYENVSDLMTSQLLIGLNVHKLGHLHIKLKFRVNVSWDYILLVADSVGFDISEYFSDVVG